MLLIFLSIFSRNPDECKIVDRNFVPLIRAEIEGKEFFFILDTGSSKVSAGNIKFYKDWQASHIRHISAAVENRTGYRIMGIIGNNNLRDKIIDLKNKRIYYPKVKTSIK